MGQGYPEPKKKMSWKRKVLIALGIILLVGVIAAAWLLNKIQEKFDKVTPKEISVSDSVDKVVEQNEVLKGYTNIAIFGVDARDNSLDALNHTDTIIICSINNDTKRINLVSVYRDLLIKDIKGKDAYGADYPDGVFRKATESYYFGGPQSAVAMLNANLDLNISSFVTVNWSIVSDVVDAVDGVDIELSEAEVAQLNYYIDETAEASGKKANHIEKAGVHHLDGVQATTYARIREIDSDFKRTERQRLVIQKVMEKTKELSLGKINRLADAILPKVMTNMKLPEMLKLALAAKDYTIGESSGFPYNLNDANYYGASIVVAVDLKTNVAMLHDKLFGEKNYMVSPTLQGISDELTQQVNSVSPGLIPQNNSNAAPQQPVYVQPTPVQPVQPVIPEPVPTPSPVPETPSVPETVEPTPAPVPIQPEEQKPTPNQPETPSQPETPNKPETPTPAPTPEVTPPVTKPQSGGATPNTEQPAPATETTPSAP